MASPCGSESCKRTIQPGENRSLASPEAITTFASTLTELRCNVVLTTRQEHFRATFGNFDHLFEGLSWRGGGNRNIRLLELQPWSEAQVVELLSAAIAAPSPPSNNGAPILRVLMIRDLAARQITHQKYDVEAFCDALRHVLRVSIGRTITQSNPRLDRVPLLLGGTGE